MPKEIPILYATSMVQAIKEERKDTTRRMNGLDTVNSDPNAWRFVDRLHGNAAKDKAEFVYRFHNDTTHENINIKCPYGLPGDVLWVRESWRVHSWYPDEGELTIGFSVGDTVMEYIPEDEEVFNRLWIQCCDDMAKAGYQVDAEERYSDYDVNDLRLRPSIHMPKAGARIWLEVLEVKVERLHDITEDQAKAEGLKCLSKDQGRTYKYGIPDADGLPGTGKSIGWVWSEWEVSATTAFQKLWERINGAESWTANPWVWVIKFKVLSTTGKPQSLTT